MIWAGLSFLAAICSAAMMLLQERWKVEPFAMVIWAKVACILIALPFVIYYGLPRDPWFYGFLTIQAVMFAINDLVLFRQVPLVGAGIVSRLVPITILLSFLAWFIIDPGLLRTYANHPAITLLIFLVLTGATYSAMRLRRCAVSWPAVRALWFVLLANILGPVTCKLITLHAPAAQAPFAFTMVEAAMMIALWLIYILIRKPIPLASLLDSTAMCHGLVIGVAIAGLIFTATFALYYVDNPGYVTAVRLLDALLIVGAHKLLGKKDDSDIMAGLGIVACAILLVILREQII